jgi:ABC-type sugar transport system permease subunit
MSEEKLSKAKNTYDLKWFIIFTASALIIYTLFWVLPIIFTFLISFTNWNGITPLNRDVFVGFRNYINMLGDPILRIAVRNNLIYGAAMILFMPVLSFCIAFILERYVPLKTLFRTFAYLPAVLPSVVTVLIWKWIFNPNYGLFNMLLRLIGLDSLTRGWVTDPKTALAAVILTALWKGIPTFVVLNLAGLQNVPTQMEEAARIDGAGTWQVIRHVVLPSMRGVQVTIYTLIIIDVFRVFDLIYIMTNGGPGYYSTEMILTYVYKASFSSRLEGYANAISFTTIVLVMLINSIQLHFSMKSNE